VLKFNKLNSSEKAGNDWRGVYGHARPKSHIGRAHGPIYPAAAAALKLKGVLGIITADDVPAFPRPTTRSSPTSRFMWASRLAVAAETEQLAQDAIDLIKITYEPVPFVVDPLDNLHPAGPTARLDGNVANPNVKYQTIKWTARDFAVAGDGNLPMGKPTAEWSYGDLDAGFKEAKLVLDESFVVGAQGTTAWSPAPPWRTGKTARSSCSARARARPR
jgi:CO/xanthine dehydrogenase Mo-binding subunit